MPYVHPDVRKRMKKDQRPTNAGELNYWITLGIIEDINSSEKRLWTMIWWRLMRFYTKAPKNYQTHNDIAGALYNAYREYKRRVGKHSRKLKRVVEKLADYFYELETVRYEKIKIAENGDVYNTK